MFALFNNGPATQLDYDPPLELVGDARCALFGEASHDTHELHGELP
jgi:hypothetical protein